MPRIAAAIRKIAHQPHRRACPLGVGGLADEVELVRQRAAILAPADRALVMLYLDNGRCFAEVARLAGVSETTVSRRVGRLVRRLMDGQYIACLRNRDRLGRLGEIIARDHLIDGMSIGEIALRRRITVYRVRKTLTAIRRLLNERPARRRRRRKAAKGRE